MQQQEKTGSLIDHDGVQAAAQVPVGATVWPHLGHCVDLTVQIAYILPSQGCVKPLIALDCLQAIARVILDSMQLPLLQVLICQFVQIADADDLGVYQEAIEQTVAAFG